MSIQRRGDAGFQAILNTGANIKAACEAAFPGVDYTYLIKDRANANNWQMLDTLRGSNAVLQTNATAAETTYSAPTGNSVGYVWRRGAAFGHDVVLYTGNGANRTIAHSLNVEPHMIWVKGRTGAVGGNQNWRVYHRNANASPASGGLLLSSTGAFGAASGYWNNTAPTSSVFSVGTDSGVNNSDGTYIAYLWTSIPGFSLFGSYRGNGSTDGPFVWCGFKPRFVMIKSATASATEWCIYDAARLGYNPDNNLLRIGAVVEQTDDDIDFTAGGFKLRRSSPNFNDGNTFIFAAFAEVPFKFATAR